MWRNDWTSQAPQLSGDYTPGCTAICRSLLYPRTRALQVTDWKLTIVITMENFIVKCSRLEVPQPPAAGSGTAHTQSENDGHVTTASRPIGKRPFNYIDGSRRMDPWLIYELAKFTKVCHPHLCNL